LYSVQVKSTVLEVAALAAFQRSMSDCSVAAGSCPASAPASLAPAAPVEPVDDGDGATDVPDADADADPDADAAGACDIGPTFESTVPVVTRPPQAMGIAKARRVTAREPRLGGMGESLAPACWVRALCVCMVNLWAQ
jgi:hypothetical protein